MCKKDIRESNMLSTHLAYKMHSLGIVEVGA